MITPVILCGGSGSRLWPISRDASPKQFHKIDNEFTLLQNTLNRLDFLESVEDPVIVCNREHRFVINDQFAEIDRKPGKIYLENIARNTLPAITIAAMGMKPNELLLVLPADHHINNQKEFCRSVEQAKSCAQDGYLVCFGATPDKPDTGFGYIRQGKILEKAYPGTEICEIHAFTEKPETSIAQNLIDGGAYWNSGVFLFNATALINQVREHAPSVYYYCQLAMEHAERHKSEVDISMAIMHHCPSVSIDNGVMEHTCLGAVAPLHSDWNDVGTWRGTWEALEKNSSGNTIKGDVLVKDVKNCCIISESRLVAAIGLEGHVIVETPDAVLVARQEDTQKVRHLVAQLRNNNREEILTHKKVLRPWGYYECLETSAQVQVKRLVVNPHSRLSLQRHQYRNENWTVVNGKAHVVNGKRALVLGPSESTYIPALNLHQLENQGDEPLEIIEVQTGTYFGEDDIERFDDDYGRVDEKMPALYAVS